MLKNYLKIAWRNLLRKKVYSAISITGLAVGVACCVLITMYVQDELSYDRYNTNINNIYRVLHAYRNIKDVDVKAPPSPQEYQVWGNAPVGAALSADFPEVKKVTQFTSPFTYLLEHNDRRFQQDGLLFADSATFDIFSWRMLAGNPKKALEAPYSIVLTKSTAQKYFGNENPVGQTLRAEGQFALNVTGVMEDVPANSHFTFNGLVSMNTFRQMKPGIFSEWGYIDFYTYFIVPEHTDMKAMEAKIPGFVARHVPKDDNETYTLAFEPLAAAYLHSQAGRQPGVTGSLSNVYIFSLIAVFILLIACINFINLSTARSMERAREVGVRKAVGAYQKGLVYQFLTESILLSLIAVVLAIVLVLVALPAVSEISGKPLNWRLLLSLKLAPAILCMPLILGLLAGSYPAWVLARFRPVEVLKGQFRSSGSGVILRKALVVIQFSLSVALIAGTAIVYSQLKHLRSHTLGFRQDQMLVINYAGDNKVNQSIDAVKAALARNPAVQSITASRAVPGDFFPNASTLVELRNGDMKVETPALYEIDYDFIPAYEMKMAAGRAYSRDFPSDVEQSLLLNEAAAKLYGYANPEDIIGKRFEQWGRKGQVIGIVKDFNYQSLHKKVEPLVIRMAPSYVLNKISLRIKTDNLPQTIKELEKTWSSLAPHRPFLYTFLDQAFNLQYKQDEHFGELFAAFAALTIFIACLGLFGLATYATEQRVKEIGIRKVLGASVSSIISLLSSDFIRLVLIAIVIATPAVWWAMQQWLQSYAYRIEIQWWMIGLAGILAVITAMITVSFLAMKAAFMNPIKALKTE
ncbi:ABC transporter permease [Chitinophaga tropicalis]|uniref:FtsX-like permease family protein n=1 Tax=Chitinophaga tropicalis TaxID=2683588 RepID=A0A7K1U4B5_9BACT|nr:ABC transporter permease [Chitinophaga tropicalis]MVT09198.1 FtsX-like permease family protein [Chitinophaga tropicalis]